MDYNKRPGKNITTIGDLLNKNIKPTISIITPFYNGGETLLETANSVISQTYPFFEWIIVNDGSPDKESVKKLENVSKIDSRIKVYHKENGGPSDTRDFGIKKASKDTKYIFFLDCDDIMENTMLEVLYWTLETHKDASFAYTTMVNFGDREFIWEQYLTVEKEKRDNLICISTMIRKEDLLSVGCFEIKEKAMYEDWNLWLKLLAAGKKPIRVNAPIFWYRINSTGEFQRAKQNNDKAMALINGTASTIKKDVEIIQYPRINKKYEIKALKNMLLPEYKCNKKKILFILPWTVLGGADLFNLELIKGLDIEKFDPIVITTLPSTNDLRNEFTNVVSEYYDLTTFLDTSDYLNFVDYIIDSRKVDTIYVSNSKIGYYMLPFIKNKYSNIKVVDYIHSIDPKDLQGGFGRCSKDVDDYIDKTYCCNNFTKKELKEKFNKENVETLYIGTDEKRFDKTKFNKEQLKQKYNIPSNKKIITFIARLSEEKRPELFVKISKKLLETRNDVHFIIAGDGNLYKKVRSSINKNFTMLGSINTPEEIYAISDITVNCSSLEGLALTSYESLAMEVPVISTSVGGQKELIDDTVGGIVEFNPKNETKEIKDYVDKINNVLDNLEILSKNCRKKILEGFTLNHIITQFNKIFNNLEPRKNIAKNGNKLIFELALDSTNAEHINNVKYYYKTKFDLDYDNIKDNKIELTLKQRIKNKCYRICTKYNCVKEAKNILNLIYQTYKITFGLLTNIIYFIKFLVLSICSCFIILIKILGGKHE